MTNMADPKTIGICDTQPVTIEGLQALLNASSDMQVVGTATTLAAGMELLKQETPSIMLIDKAFGLAEAMDWISGLRASGTSSIVWGVSMNEAEALRIMQAGAQGVLRK